MALPGQQHSDPVPPVTTANCQDASYLSQSEAAEEQCRSMPGQVERSLLDKSNSSQSLVRDEGFSSLSSQGNQLLHTYRYDSSAERSQTWSPPAALPQRMRQSSSSPTMSVSSPAETSPTHAAPALYSMATPLSSPDEERPISLLLSPAPAPPPGPEVLDLQHARTRSRSDNSQMLAGGGGVDTISSSSHAHNQFPFLPYTGMLPPHRPEQRISFPGRARDTSLPHHASRPAGAQADSTVPVTMDIQPLMPLVFQPSLNLAMLQYNSIWARIHHFLYAFIYLAHIPITLFFDYSVLYALVQIALHPHPSTSISSGADSITVRANPWWILVGFYALCTLVWLGVILIYQVYYCYIRQWKQGHPSITAIYLKPSAFNLCSIRSFPHYSFLWRIRLGAFSGIGSISANTKDGIIELCYSCMQNWPTIVTVIPRAAASLLLLLSFTPAHSNEPLPSQDQLGRDGLYFKPDGMLTRYAAGVILAHFSWALYRILLLILASLTYWSHTRHSGSSIPSPSEGYQDPYTRTSWALSFASTTPIGPQTWKDRLRLRILEAVLLSSSRERWRAAIERREKSNARRRRLSRNSASEGRRSSKLFAAREGKRKPVVVQSQEMTQERPALAILPTPYTGPFASPENGQAVIEEIPQSYTPPTPRTTEERETRDLPDRPSTSLGFNAPVTQSSPPTRQIEIAEDNASDDDGFEDEDEAERIAWAQHPPLSPRGSLILARQGLSQEYEAASYWNTAPPTSDRDERQNGNSFEISRERILGDIIEESEEEASLRRANSNRRTMSSRQSSLMRPSSALDRLERAIHEGPA